MSRKWGIFHLAKGLLHSTVVAIEGPGHDSWFSPSEEDKAAYHLHRGLEHLLEGGSGGEDVTESDREAAAEKAARIERARTEAAERAKAKAEKARLRALHNTGGKNMKGNGLIKGALLVGGGFVAAKYQDKIVEGAVTVYNFAKGLFKSDVPPAVIPTPETTATPEVTPTPEAADAAK